MKSKIVAHCLVRNEERFIWYALNSALLEVDRIMVWDTGSTDKTVAIVKSVKSPKIVFKAVGSVDAETFTTVRNQMLAATPKDFTWLMILDGDEIWSAQAIKTATNFVRAHPEKESLVVRTNNLVGDIYHNLPATAGRYHLAGRTGHLNLRFINLKQIPGLHVAKPHGQQGYFDAQDKLIQDHDPSKIGFLDLAYHHATHLQRSSSRANDTAVIKRAPKLKYELGELIPRAQIPEVFFKPHPAIVPDVTASAPFSFWLKAALFTPFKQLKRLIIKTPSGY